MIENHNRCSKVSDTKICPSCYSSKIVKNGKTKTKKQQYFCKNCYKRFLDFYTYQGIKNDIIALTGYKKHRKTVENFPNHFIG